MKQLLFILITMLTFNYFSYASFPVNIDLKESENIVIVDDPNEPSSGLLFNLLSIGFSLTSLIFTFSGAPIVGLVVCIPAAIVFLILGARQNKKRKRYLESIAK